APPRVPLPGAQRASQETRRSPARSPACSATPALATNSTTTPSSPPGAGAPLGRLAARAAAAATAAHHIRILLRSVRTMDGENTNTAVSYSPMASACAPPAGRRPSRYHPEMNAGAASALLLIALSSSPKPAALSLRVAARAQQPGEVVLLTLRGPVGTAAPVVTAFGREGPVFEDGAGRWQAMVGIDLDVALGTSPISARIGTEGGALAATADLHVKGKALPVRA